MQQVYADSFEILPPTFPGDDHNTRSGVLADALKALAEFNPELVVHGIPLRRPIDFYMK